MRFATNFIAPVGTPGKAEKSDRSNCSTGAPNWRTIRFRMRTFGKLLSLVIAVAFSTGCDRDATPARPAPTTVKIPVLATIHPLAEMVQRIGGDAVQVEWVVDAGQRPEDVEPT